MAGETKLGTAQIPIRATLDQLDKDLSGAKNQVASALKGIGKIALGGLALGAVAATGAIAAIGPAAIEAASDLNESMSKAKVVFGDSTAAIDQFGKTSAKAFGISKQQAYEASGTFGNLFTTIGLGQGDAANMSVNLVKLAADLASFNNLDPTLVLEKLRSGLVGEVEPLRSLGVNLTEAQVQQEALNMGLAKAAGELTPAMKLQARYALIMKQTTTAQGDFARTSDGLANTQRILNATFKDISAAIGTALLPGVLNIARAIQPVVEALLPPLMQLLDRLSPVIAAAGANIADFVTRLVSAGNFQPFLDMLNDLGTKFWNWLTGPNGAASQAGTMISGVMTSLSKLFSDNWPTISATLADWGKKFWDWLTAPGGVIDTSITKLDELVKKFTDWANSDAARAGMSQMGQSLGENLVTGVVAAGESGGAKDRITGLINSLLMLLKDIIQAQMTLITSIGGSLASGFLDGVVNTIKTEGPEKVKQAVLDLLGPTFMAGIFSTQGKQNLGNLGEELRSKLPPGLGGMATEAIPGGAGAPAAGPALNFSPNFYGMTEQDRAWYSAEAKRQAELVFLRIVKEAR
jgi:hypothetical protein